MANVLFCSKLLISLEKMQWNTKTLDLSVQDFLKNIWAICWKSGKLEKLKNNYIFVKLVSIIVNFFHILWNLISDMDFFCGIVTSFILLRQIILYFWDKFVEKNDKKVGDFNITFQNESIFF